MARGLQVRGALTVTNNLELGSSIRVRGEKELEIWLRALSGSC